MNKSASEISITATRTEFIYRRIISVFIDHPKALPLILMLQRRAMHSCTTSRIYVPRK